MTVLVERMAESAVSDNTLFNIICIMRIIVIAGHTLTGPVRELCNLLLHALTGHAVRYPI